MKINLSTDSGLSKLTAELDKVQHLSRTRTVSAERIAAAADSLTDQLSIPATALEGAVVALDLNAQNFPRAYKYQPESTIVGLRFSNRHWWVVDIHRGATHRAGHDADLRLSDSAKKALLERFSALTV